jgi:hypothetical protein
MDDSIPSLEHVVRRSQQKRTRRITVMAAGLACAVAGVGVGTSMVRTGSEQPEAGVRELQGAWSMPQATDNVSIEPRPRASNGTSKTAETRRPQARVVKGPWTVVVSGHRLTLRAPVTHTAIVQRIDYPEPGRFNVVEDSSGGTASFGCTNIGEYSYERTDSGTLNVQEVADSCEARAEILVAGSWILPEVSTSTDNVPTQEPTQNPTDGVESSPTPSVPETDTPSPVDTTPEEAQNTPG